MKTKNSILTLALALYGAFSFAQSINGSAHDFVGLGWYGAEDEICKACHTPHSASATVTPLWNHAETAEAFTMYSGGGTYQATTAAAPQAESKLCLSCHDGVTNLDAFGGAAGTTAISGSAVVGTNLGTEHPVSMQYDAALATLDGGLHDPTTTASAIPASSGNIDVDMLFGGSNDQMECASCHDVHGARDNTVGNGLLRKANASSALCLTCHNK